MVVRIEPDREWYPVHVINDDNDYGFFAEITTKEKKKYDRVMREFDEVQDLLIKLEKTSKEEI